MFFEKQHFPLQLLISEMNELLKKDRTDGFDPENPVLKAWMLYVKLLGEVSPQGPVCEAVGRGESSRHGCCM